jgi:hypothetical protein
MNGRDNPDPFGGKKLQNGVAFMRIIDLMNSGCVDAAHTAK